MMAKFATSFGFSLLMATAIGAWIYSNKVLTLTELTQFGVLAAGAIALWLATRTRSYK